MWLIDLIHDPEWIKALDGRLPAPKLRINTQSKSDPTLDSELLIYGDESLRHFRILVKHASNKEECEIFVQKQLNKTICTIETVVTMATGRAFDIWRPFNSPHIIQFIGEVDQYGNDPVPIVELNKAFQPIDYAKVLQVMAIQFPGSEDYLFFFKRGIDHRLDADYRWLCLYKICELRFHPGGKVHLYSVPEWKAFLSSLQTIISPYLPPARNADGYIEELRKVAAHIGRHDLFGHDPRIEETLLLMQHFACEIINNLPGNPGIKIQAEGLRI